MDNEKRALRVSVVSILLNILLTIIKFGAGLFAHSSSMISDAVHSLSDVLSTFVVIVGIKISNKEADDGHPYGHERIECVFAIVLATMLLFTGLFIGYKGIIGIYDNRVVVPGIYALVAAVISIVMKECMFWYTRKVAIEINSGAMLADAWHHRSDALSSIGSFIGILGSRLGFYQLDAVASVVICLFIFKVSYDIFMDAIDKMVDKACDFDTINDIKDIVLDNKYVKNIDDIKTRKFGNKIYIDLEISIDKRVSFVKSHQIAHSIHDNIENNMCNVKHCMIHVNPYM